MERVSGCRSRGFRAFKGIRPRLNIEFQNLGLKLLDGTSIIEGVTGRSDAAPRCAALQCRSYGRFPWHLLVGRHNDITCATARHNPCRSLSLLLRRRFCHSRLTAIMGPSGAGKSTFLNVVMGRANQYQGHMQGTTHPACSAACSPACGLTLIAELLAQRAVQRPRHTLPAQRRRREHLHRAGALSMPAWSRTPAHRRREGQRALAAAVGTALHHWLCAPG